MTAMHRRYYRGRSYIDIFRRTRHVPTAASIAGRGQFSIIKNKIPALRSLHDSIRREPRTVRVNYSGKFMRRAACFGGHVVSCTRFWRYVASGWVYRIFVRTPRIRRSRRGLGGNGWLAAVGSQSFEVLCRSAVIVCRLRNINSWSVKDSCFYSCLCCITLSSDLVSAEERFPWVIGASSE